MGVRGKPLRERKEILQDQKDRFLLPPAKGTVEERRIAAKERGSV